MLRVDRFGCFGKLPLSREFLVGEARELSESRFDRWVGEGLGLAKMILGSRFDERVTSFPPFWFVWGGGSGARLLAGRMAPSEDGAGRKHPFALFGYCDARRSNGLAAASFTGLVDPILRLWDRAEEAGTPGALLDLVRQEPPTPDLDGRSAYSDCVGSLRAADFWSDALGPAAEPSLRCQVMQAFVETVVPMKSRDPREIRMGIRFPIASADPAKAALEAAFWTDLTSRKLGKPLERATLFWNVREDAGRPGDLYLFFSEPSGPQWTCLADRDASIETVSFLDRPYGSHPEQRMEPPLRALLDSTTATLADYLAWAGRGVM